MRKLLCILICTTLLIIFDSGCTPSDLTSGIFEYSRYPASFTATFLSEYGEVECEVTRNEEMVSLAVKSPERSSYISVAICGNKCVITSPVDDLTMSEEASMGLTSVFDLLFRGDEGVVSVKKSSDGLTTVITYSDGVVTVGEDGLPVAVTSRAMNGEMRTVRILGYEKIN